MTIPQLAAAWNKFYADGELQFLRPTDAGKIGITIRGTPYKAEDRRGRASSNDHDPERPVKPVQGTFSVSAEAQL